MSLIHETEYVPAIVIGGGQAGLSVGYHLAQRGVRFVILDANDRIGDAWRRRWDSLRLFSPAQFDGLAGMPFPAPADTFPTKAEMADYLEAYADRFELPVRTGVRVDRLSRSGGRYRVAAGDRQFEADQVVVAMSSYQVGRVPAFASRLDPSITQLHSSEYRNPSQLREGAVLWWVPATREPRSRSSSRAVVTRPGCREGTSARSRSTSGAPQPASS